MTGLTVSNHAITYGKTNKVFSAGTADSAATLTGNITTGQVTDLTTKIQTTKVNSATTADSATNASKVNNHTVESNVPSNAVFTDTATTQTGHYTPSASASTEGSTTGFIRQIKLDSKKHVVGIVSGTTSFTETAVTTKAGTTGSTATPVLSSIATGGTKGHELTLNYTNKVNSATTADSATNATVATKVKSALTVNMLNATGGTASTVTFDGSANKTVNIPANTDEHVTAVGNHYTATTATKTGGTTTATAASAVKGITYDAAGHIVGITTGSVLTAQTSLTTANGSTGNAAAAVITGITTGGTAGHQLTLNKSNKVFSASTSDSALTTVSAITSWSAQTTILGPTYSYSGLSYVTSATSIADAYSALTKEVIESEIVAAAALNDLNDRVLATSGAYVELVDEINDSEKVIAASLNDLNDRVIELSGNVSNIHVDMILGSGYTYSGLSYINSATSIADAFSAITKVVIDDELVTAGGLNDLNDRIIELSGSVENIHVDMTLGSGYTYSGLPYVNSATSIADAYSALTKEVNESDIVAAAALNDLNDRVLVISGAYVELVDEINDSEKVIAASLNDLNDGVIELSGNVNTKRRIAIGLDGIEPNVVYSLGQLTGTVSFVLAPAVSQDIVNHYYWTFETGTNPPIVTWPSVTKWGGNCVQNGSPVLVANAHYEVSIMDGYAFIVGV